MYLPLENPKPNFQEFEGVLAGRIKPRRVHFAELSVDREVMDYIMENLMSEKLLYSEAEKARRKKLIAFKDGEEITLLTNKEEKTYIRQLIWFYYRMGYDYFPDMRPHRYLMSMILPKVRIAKDTAIIPRRGSYYGSAKESSREWVEEKTGVISTWKDFKDFPWHRIRLNLGNYYDFLEENLPGGMKIMISTCLYQTVLDRLLGHEGFYYLLYDDPKLVEEITDKWGQVVYYLYKDAICKEFVGGIFHADDLGYKSGTMVSPNILRKFFLPWFEKYAQLAHEHGKMFWLHCCGNVLEIMEDLIGDVGIDAFHSFQDVIIPVTEFKKKYGDRIATLGGVDVDKLARLNENNLRKYIREILDKCMLDGRYALGSGNSITNYIPVKNYLIMLEEGLNFGK